MKQFERVVIVGVGLLGGSIGLALRNRKLAKRVIGFSPRGNSLDAAVECGAIDGSCQTLEEACTGSDLAIVCTPVQSVAEYVEHCVRYMLPQGWVTDVGSTKERIVTAIATTVAIARFVGSHPLAGSEKSGVEFARENLLENKLVVVTPIATDSATAPRQLELASQAEQLWKSLGARTLRMTPKDHDAAVARTSHLPHILASALAAATPDAVLPLAASGWCDTTRVASGGVELWRQIIDENRTPIVDALEDFSATLQLWLNALRNEDGPAIEQLLTDGKKKRDSLGN